MLRTFLIILITLVFVFSAFFAGNQISSLNLNLEETKTLNSQLNNQLRKSLQEKEIFKEELQQAKEKITNLYTSLKERDRQLSQLRNVQALRQTLVNAKASIEQLNKKLNQIKNEKAVLEDTNLNITNRLQNTTRELIRVMEDLKLTKQQLTHIEKAKILPLKKKIEKLSKSGKRENRKFSRLKEELTKLQEERLALIGTNRSKELTIKDLKAGKSSLEKKMARLKKGIDRQTLPIQALEDELKELKVTLAKRERQVKFLESESAKLNSIKASQEEKLLRQQKTIDELNLENKNIKIQISQLSEDLSRKRWELGNQRKEAPRLKREVTQLQVRITGLEKKLTVVQKDKEDLQARVSQLKALKDASEVSTLYESARDQIRRLSEILVKKELELDQTKKESLNSKEKLNSLQAKLSRLEENLSKSRAHQARAKELEAEKLSLESRFEDINSLYNSFKGQIGQLSDILAKKELELDQRRGEILFLKEESAGLKARSSLLERELTETKERQRETLEDLTAAIRLNAALQERMIGVSQSLKAPIADIEEKQKAEELRRKIKVILEPQS
jgi:chromosome segregation ATPase